MANRKGQISRWTRILCALALILVGFAHKPPQVFTTVPASEFSAYVLPDGTLPFLCDVANLDGDKGPMHDHGRCEACLLSASTLLPPPPSLAVPPRRVAETLFPQSPTSALATPFRLTSAPRGPPSLSHA